MNYVVSLEEYWGDFLLGRWPYVIVFKRDFEIALWVEGDVTAFDPPTQEAKEAVLSYIAERYGKIEIEE